MTLFISEYLPKKENELYILKAYSMKQRIYLSLAHMGGREQEFIKEAFDTNWVVPLGPNVNAFEEELKHFVGQNKEVVALSAGTAAIHLGLIQLGVEAGETVTFDNVIAVSNDGLKVGEDVKDASVTATVVENGKAKKVIVYKYKRKTGYHKKNGHRQQFTKVKIEKINA